MQSQLIQEKSLSFFRGVQDMLPLSVAVIPWGILAGSAAINAGLSVMQAVGMSALVFAGAAQLVSLSMLMTGASLLSILITVKIAQAFQSRKSNIQVQSQGRVVAVLKDDNDGSRHQKFIVELPNTMTVLVAHNIDLAPRIERLQKGDTVGFNGEYEYSEKGGVIHWTHHDPQQRHEGGWLKHQGKTYE